VTASLSKAQELKNDRLIYSIWSVADEYNPAFAISLPLTNYFSRMNLAINPHSELLTNIRIRKAKQNTPAPLFEILCALKKTDERIEDICAIRITASGERIGGQVVKLLNRDTSGCAVRIMPATKVMGLTVDLNSALLLSAYYRIPVWAVMEPEKLPSFLVPPCTKYLAIFSPRNRQCIEASKELSNKLNSFMSRPVFSTVIPPLKGVNTWEENYLRFDKKGMPFLNL